MELRHRYVIGLTIVNRAWYRETGFNLVDRAFRDALSTRSSIASRSRLASEGTSHGKLLDRTVLQCFRIVRQQT